LFALVAADWFAGLQGGLVVEVVVASVPNVVVEEELGLVTLEFRDPTGIAAEVVVLVTVIVMVWVGASVVERVVVLEAAVVVAATPPSLAALKTVKGVEPRPPEAVTRARATRSPPSNPATKRFPSMVMHPLEVGR
jgi:hypothetical protein